MGPGAGWQFFRVGQIIIFFQKFNHLTILNILDKAKPDRLMALKSKQTWNNTCFPSDWIFPDKSYPSSPSSFCCLATPKICLPRDVSFRYCFLKKWPGQILKMGALASPWASPDRVVCIVVPSYFESVPSSMSLIFVCGGSCKKDFAF